MIYDRQRRGARATINCQDQDSFFLLRVPQKLQIILQMLRDLRLLTSPATLIYLAFFLEREYNTIVKLYCREVVV